MISPKICHCIHPFFRKYAPVSTPSSYCIRYSVIKRYSVIVLYKMHIVQWGAYVNSSLHCVQEGSAKWSERYYMQRRPRITLQKSKWLTALSGLGNKAGRIWFQNILGFMGPLLMYIIPLYTPLNKGPKLLKDFWKDKIFIVSWYYGRWCEKGKLSFTF